MFALLVVDDVLQSRLLELEHGAGDDGLALQASPTLTKP